MHIIRLRHPWQAAWRDLSTDDTLAPNHGQTNTGQFRRAHYSRQFHRPSGLHEQQPISLVVQPTSGVSLILQTDKLQPLPAAGTVSIDSILLNSHALSLSAATNDAQSITHLSVRIESALESFNELEVICGLAAGEMVDDETAVVQSGDVFSASPPALSQWAEVRLEIDD